MLIEQFKYHHFKHLAKLLDLRIMSPEQVLPSFGLVAWHQGEVVAMGFVREVEGNIGLLDSFITNPNISPELRDKALNKLTTKIIKVAKFNKISGLLAISSDLNTLMRASRHGFLCIDHKVMSLPLTSRHGV